LATFLVNIFRTSLVCVVAYYVGRVPAVIFHVNGRTILILLWLFAFWYFAHRYLLETQDENERSTIARKRSVI